MGVRILDNASLYYGRIYLALGMGNDAEGKTAAQKPSERSSHGGYHADLRFNARELSLHRSYRSKAKYDCCNIAINAQNAGSRDSERYGLVSTIDFNG